MLQRLQFVVEQFFAAEKVPLLLAAWHLRLFLQPF